MDTKTELWVLADSPACSLRPGQLSRLERAGLVADVLAVCQDVCGKSMECSLFRRVYRRTAKNARAIRATRAVREIARGIEL